MDSHIVIYVMGVSGSGKSTIGKKLANYLNIPFFDGDDFHPEVNVRKMASGKALNDTDRQSWLTDLNTLARQQLKSTSCVIVCSALKENYRKILSKKINNQVKWVHLTGTFDAIYKRLTQRTNHFMPPELLKSQYSILELPKNAISVDIEMLPQDVVKQIVKNL
ncbi:gluconate kinase [Tamlana nanhaiensis]|uniref:Gluconokinase n=1 Tax=Neotamlana nanhaiensis TaxID=1382798 RepID=A0A0D7VX84_9FLAO|nr:gluconokinase [Tamlana nanhaiensis]KJD31451.1 gluconate kinase [Tamlana nanhaiensis]